MATKKTAAAEEAKSEIVKATGLDALIERAPTNERFSVAVGDDDYLWFHRPVEAAELARLRRSWQNKAKESYQNYFPESKDSTGGVVVDQDKMQVLTDCFKLFSLAEDKEQVTVTKLLALAKKWGAVFQGMVATVDAHLAVGESLAVSAGIEQAKNG